MNHEIPGKIRRTALLVAFDLEAWRDSDRSRFALRPMEAPHLCIRRSHGCTMDVSDMKRLEP